MRSQVEWGDFLGTLILAALAGGFLVWLLSGR